MVLLQTIMTGLILGRHSDNVTRILARSFARDISLLVELYEESAKDDAAVARIEKLANSRLALGLTLSLIHISEPTRLLSIPYAVFCLKKTKADMPALETFAH